MMKRKHQNKRLAREPIGRVKIIKDFLPPRKLLLRKEVAQAMQDADTRKTHKAKNVDELFDDLG